MRKINLVTDFDRKQKQKITLIKEDMNNNISDCLEKEVSSEFLDIDDVRNIPATYDKIPSGYVNNVAHRGNYSEEEMNQTLEDGTRKILHLDLDFGKICKLSCPHCFKNNKDLQITTNKKELSQEELQNVLLDFKKLGLKTVKITGAGEPFDNKDFLPFLQFLHDNGIGISVFTKGYVIGSDSMVNRLYGEYGIKNGEDLAKKLKELDVSVLLGFNSFDKELQKKYSGVEKWNDYVDFRDKALVNLINAGLNEYKDGEPTRLGMIMAPMKPENLDEIITIYDWARMRNIYPLGCPANEAGKGKDENQRIEKEAPEYIKNLIEVYVNINIRNIDNGIITLEKLEKEGISLYPGCHPCTQTRVGGYLNLYGELLSCPGHDTDRKELQISQDITKEKDYLEMWKNSENYKRLGFNQKCIARDGSTLPIDFYDTIMDKIKKHYN